MGKTIRHEERKPFILGRLGTGDVLIQSSFSIPHGSGTQFVVDIPLQPDFLILIGKALEANPGEPGHAIWHLTAPEAPAFPCHNCSGTEGKRLAQAKSNCIDAEPSEGPA